MKLALAIQTPEVPALLPIALLSGELDDKLAKAAALGFDGVELITTSPADLDAADLHQRLRACNLKVSAVASGGMAFAVRLTLLSPDPEIAALARQRLDELIDFAGRLGAGVVTVGSFRGRSGGDKTASLYELAAVLRSAGERAASQNVRLALEPLNRYEADLIHNAAQGLEFLRQVDHPAVGLLLDTYHVNIEESSWTEPFRIVMEAGKLFYVHIGDNNRLPPGQGLIDFPAILNALQQSGYDGWLSAELLGIPDPDTAAEQAASMVRPWIKALP